MFFYNKKINLRIMTLLPLTVRCAEIIINDENLLKLSKTLPIDIQMIIQNLKKDQEIVSQWRWFVTPMGWLEKPNEIVLTAKNYEDLILLNPKNDECVCPDLLKKIYLFQNCHQKNHNPFSISEIIAFVNEKLNIRWYNYFAKREICLYCFPTSVSKCPTSTEFSLATKLVDIHLPDRYIQTVKISIPPLSEINQTLEFPWSAKTYRKFRNFIIYFVNQIALDNIGKSDLILTGCTTPANRVHLAKKAKNIEDIREHLFGKYTDSRFWFLND